MKKVIKRLKEFDSDIESKGFNLRERLYLYSGIASGVLIPIITVRYLIPRSFVSEGILQEAASLGLSALVSLPLSFYGSISGACFGSYGAEKIRSKRIEQERNLEQSVRG